MTWPVNDLPSLDAVLALGVSGVISDEAAVLTELVRRRGLTETEGDVRVTTAADRVCIVGAGPAGLSVARALSRLGIPYDQYERHSDVGGIWDLENPGDADVRVGALHLVTQGLGLLRPPDAGQLPRLPEPPADPRLHPGVRRDARASRADPVRHRGHRVRAATGDRWTVTLADGSRHTYRALDLRHRHDVVAADADHPGSSSPARCVTRSTYRDPIEFRGRRVLVVGLGNSGADIVCDAALIADASFLSVRRGYHVIPKHIFGIPADEFGESGPSLPHPRRAPRLHRAAAGAAGRPHPARPAEAGPQALRVPPPAEQPAAAPPPARRRER